jgi:MFS-type transporter involved in bile tolerance (Atg22 family)
MSSGNLYPNNDTIDISAKSEGTSRSYNKDHERNESVIIFLPFLISPVIGRLIDENNKIRVIIFLPFLISPVIGRLIDENDKIRVIIFLPFLISPVIGRLIDENNKIYQKHYFLLTLWFVL